MMEAESGSPKPTGAAALEIHDGIDAIIRGHCSRCRKSGGSA